MDFWRLYRLILSKRWLIAAIVLLTGVVVFVGTLFRTMNKEYQSITLMQPQDPAEAQQDANVGEDATTANRQAAQDRMTNIAELISMLRSSSEIAKRTADLLKLNEEDRQKEVARILRKNGYFAQIDEDIKNQAADAVKQGDLPANKQESWIKDQQTKTHQALTDSLTKASDGSGGFGGAGVGMRDRDIIDRINKIVSYESVEGPFSTDQNIQIVNQIRIVAKSPRAAEAELYSNMAGVAFLDYYTNKSAGASTARIDLLHDKLATARKQYDEARDNLTRARQGTDITTLGNAGTASTLIVQYENSLNAAKQELVGATATVNTLKGILASTGSTEGYNLPSRENPQVRALEANVAQLRIEFKAIQESNLGENSEPYKQKKAALDQAIAELKAARAQPYTTTSANSNRQALQAQLDQALVKQSDLQNRITELQKQLDAQKQKAKSIPGGLAKLGDLQSRAELLQENVRNIEKQLSLEELRAINNGRQGSVNIVSSGHAELIEVMTTTKRITMVIYGMSLALVFSMLGIVAFDALDNAVKTAGDAQRLLDLSVIGQIPSHLSDLMRGPRVVALDPLSPAAESYRLLRTDLLFMSTERPFKSLLITPIRHSQGATTTAGNLAIALAQSGRRVILVDADLRRPKLHAVFNVSNNIGLSSILAGQEDYMAAMVPTDIQNLSIIPAGPPVMNPSELVGGTIMGTLHRRLRDNVDFVIFDAPSPVACADAAILSSIVDATLLVLRAGQAPDGAAEQQVQSRLEKARANVLGMILNDIEPERLLSARHHTAYHPPLASGNVNGSGPFPIAALPGPKVELNGTGADVPELNEPVQSESDLQEEVEPVAQAADKEINDDGNDDSHNNGNGSNGSGNGVSEPAQTISKPRIKAMSTATNGADAETEVTDAASRRTTRRTTSAPLALLIAVGASTAIGLLTLAISKGGN